MSDSNTSSLFVKLYFLQNLTRVFTFYKKRKKLVWKYFHEIIHGWEREPAGGEPAALKTGKPELLLYHHLVGKSPAARDTAELHERESSFPTELRLMDCTLPALSKSSCPEINYLPDKRLEFTSEYFQNNHLGSLLTFHFLGPKHSVYVFECHKCHVWWWKTRNCSLTVIWSKDSLQIMGFLQINEPPKQHNYFREIK